VKEPPPSDPQFNTVWDIPGIFGDTQFATLARNARVAGWMPILLFLHYPWVIGWAFYIRMNM
jgi:hypothetical protein